MTALPVVLGSRTLRRTVKVRLEFELLRLPGGTTILTVSRLRFMNYPGWKRAVSGKHNEFQMFFCYSYITMNSKSEIRLGA